MHYENDKSATAKSKDEPAAQPSGLLISIRPFPRTYDKDEDRPASIDLVPTKK